MEVDTQQGEEANGPRQANSNDEERLNEDNTSEVLSTEKVELKEVTKTDIPLNEGENGIEGKVEGEIKENGKSKDEAPEKKNEDEEENRQNQSEILVDQKVKEELEPKSEGKVKEKEETRESDSSSEKEGLLDDDAELHVGKLKHRFSMDAIEQPFKQKDATHTGCLLQQNKAKINKRLVEEVAELKTVDETDQEKTEEPEDYESLLPDIPGELFPLKRPRVDDDIYQATLPELRKKPKTGAKHSVKTVWKIDPARVTEAQVNEYLYFCRRLTQEEVKVSDRNKIAQSQKNDEVDTLMDEKHTGLKPSEMDEKCLEFLHEHNYDISYAKFSLLCNLGVGNESAVFNNKKEEGREKSSRNINAYIESLLSTKSSLMLPENEVNGEENSLVSWRKWISVAKPLIAKSQADQKELYSLLTSAKVVCNTDREKAPDAAVTLLQSIGERLKKIEEWITNAYDAVSVVKPDQHWTIEEMKDLLDNAPKGCDLVEVKQMKKVYKYLNKVCSDLKNITARLYGQERRSRKRDSKHVHVDDIQDVITRCHGLPLDLEGEVNVLERKVLEVKFLSESVERVLPRDVVIPYLQYGKRNNFVVKASFKPETLDSLRTLQSQVKECGVRFPESELLDTCILEAVDWIQSSKVALKNGANIKDMVALVKHADRIPVDLSTERVEFDTQVNQAQEWLKRVKEQIPSSLSMGKRKATRNNKAMVKESQIDLETLRTFRDEAITLGLGLEESNDMNNLVNAAEEWATKVHLAITGDESLVDQKELTLMLDELDSIPVQMENEKTMLMLEISAREWISRLDETLKSKGSVSYLEEMLDELQQLRKSIPNFSGSARGRNSKANFFMSSREQNVWKANHVKRVKDIIENANSVSRIVAALTDRDYTEDEWVELSNKKRKEMQNDFLVSVRKAMSSRKVTDPPQITLDELEDIVQRVNALPVQLDDSLVTKLKALKENIDMKRWKIKGLLIFTGQNNASDFKEIAVAAGESKTEEELHELVGPMLLTDNNEDTNDKVDVSENENKNGTIESGNTVTNKSNKTTLKDAETLLDSSSYFGIAIPEIEYLDSAINYAKRWLKQYRDIFLQSGATKHIPGQKGRKRDRESITGENNPDTGGSKKGLMLEATKLDAVFVNMLIKEAEKLMIDVNDHLEELKDALEATEEWKKRANVLLDEYKSLLKALPADLEDDKEGFRENGKYILELTSVEEKQIEDFDNELDSKYNKNNEVDELTNLDDLYTAKDLKETKKEQKERERDESSSKQESEEAAANETKSEKGEQTISLEEKDETTPSKLSFDFQWSSSLDDCLTKVISFVREGKRSHISRVAVETIEFKQLQWIVATRKWCNYVSEYLTGDRLIKNLDELRFVLHDGLRLLDPGMAKIATDNFADLFRSTVSTPTGPSRGRPKRGEKRQRLESGTLSPAAMGTEKEIQAEESEPKTETSAVLHSDREDEAVGAFFVEGPGLGCINGLGRSLKHRLLLFQKSIRLTLQWAQMARKRLQSNVKSRHYAIILSKVMEFRRLYVGSLRVVYIEEEKVIKHELRRSKAWLLKAQSLINAPKDKLPTSDDVESLLSEAVKLKTNFYEAKFLRAVLKEAKAWLTLVKKSGIEKGEASIEELRKLLKASKDIPLNISEHTGILEQATMRFCLCRGAREPVMIGCTGCEEKFHAECVGITPSAAKRGAKFSCPSCEIKANLKTHLGIVKATHARAVVAQAFCSNDSNMRKYTNWTAECLDLLMKDTSSLTTKVLVEEFSQKVTSLVEGPKLYGQFQDGCLVQSALKMKSWGVVAAWYFSKKTVLNDFQNLLQNSAKVPVRSNLSSVTILLRNMVERANTWLNRATRLLDSPESVPTSNILTEGKKLLATVRHIPIDLPEEKKLQACLDDSATRYCLCKGFNDGSFMIGCDGCDNWFHGRCVDLTQKVGETLTAWTCPQCKQAKA